MAMLRMSPCSWPAPGQREGVHQAFSDEYQHTAILQGMSAAAATAPSPSLPAL